MKPAANRKANAAAWCEDVDGCRWRKMRGKSVVGEHVIVLQLGGAAISFSFRKSLVAYVIFSLTC